MKVIVSHILCKQKEQVYRFISKSSVLKMIVILLLSFVFTHSKGFEVDYRVKSINGDYLPIFTRLHYNVQNKGSGYFLSSNTSEMHNNQSEYDNQNHWIRLYKSSGKIGCEYGYKYSSYAPICISKSSTYNYFLCEWLNKNK